MRVSYSKYSLTQGVRKVKTKTFLIISTIGLALGGGSGLSLALVGASHAAPTPQVVYSALPSVDPLTNYPSKPFQAQQTFEFGDSVHLGGTSRMLNNVTVTFSDWALASSPENVSFCAANANNCDSTGYFWPITLNVYGTQLDANGVPSQKLASVKQTVHVPWRPEGASAPCSNGDTSGWQDSQGNCDHGVAFNATFDLSNQHVTLPSDVIVSVAFNTETWGANPVGVDGPYDSLNVAVPDNQAVTVGSDTNTDGVFWNTHTCAWYSDAASKAACTAGNYGLMQDTNWTPNGTVAMQITALPGTPSTMDDCKNGGWMNVVDSNGGAFKNQGQCVSWVQHNVNGNGVPAASKH